MIHTPTTQDGDVRAVDYTADVADETIEFYNSHHFKFALVEFLELLEILLQGYYGDHYDQARQTQG